jgi:N-dimethylarginine dimethylaminohydrolase
MCAPDYFSVEYVINPWMAGNEGQLDLALAERQWRSLHDAIADVADIELMQPKPDLPDLVFTANAGFENIGFEGAGDCLIDRNGSWLWTGYGFRTEIEAHAYLTDWFDYDVVSIRLTDSRFYHIDTCLCPLSDGYLLYYPAAFDSDSIKSIEDRVPADKRIPVAPDDAANFSCNAVNINEHIFCHGFSAGLGTELKARGFVLHEVALSEFLKAGGSAKCLTLKLTEPEISS